MRLEKSVWCQFFNWTHSLYMWRRVTSLKIIWNFFFVGYKCPYISIGEKHYVVALFHNIAYFFVLLIFGFNFPKFHVNRSWHWHFPPLVICFHTWSHFSLRHFIFLKLGKVSTIMLTIIFFHLFLSLISRFLLHGCWQFYLYTFISLKLKRQKCPFFLCCWLQ